MRIVILLLPLLAVACINERYADLSPDAMPGFAERCAAQDLASPDSRTATGLKVWNGSDETVSIEWIDAEGNAVVRQALAPKASYVEESREGYVYLVRRANDCVAVVTASRANGIYYVGGDFTVLSSTDAEAAAAIAGR